MSESPGHKLESADVRVAALRDPDPALRGRMLPGVAGISIFLLILTLLNVFGALNGLFGAGRGRYGVLAICTLLVTGIFGLLRMKRWGWAIVSAGCLLLSCWYAFSFTRSHAPFFAVQALFMLLFFLYLARGEVRDRMV